MTTKDFILNFEGPFGLTKSLVPLLFDHPIAKESGLYLWTVPYFQGGYLVTYIGETCTSFGQRIKEHLIQLMGGNYRICDPDLIVKGKVEVLWNGLWRKGTRDKMPEYLERLEEFTPNLRKLLQIKVVFVAPFKTTRRLRQRLEGALAKHIKSQPAPVSSVLPLDIRYYQRKADETPVTMAIKCHCHIHGLPKELEA
jgi:hypothetical protein